MGLKICAFGSGSTGNCIYVSSGATTVLIDLGLPATRVEKCLSLLGADPDEVSVLLTHCHSDHISGLSTFCRRHPRVKAYCHESCYGSLYRKLEGARSRITAESGDFFVGDITVSPFKVSHDVPCVGYGLLFGGRKAAVLTDVGEVGAGLLESLADSDLVVLECNHDVEMLKNNPAYPPVLKSRILSGKGHLSNADCAECVSYLAAKGVKQFVLAHLSRENNYPELAFRTCREVLSRRGFTEGKDVLLEVAPADRMSGLYEIS